MAGNWDWHRRKEYSKREVESLAMLREILSASKPKEKRAVISKFNPHFYILFPDGVKHYAVENEQDSDKNRGEIPDDNDAKALLRTETTQIYTQDTDEKEKSHGI